MRKRRLGMRLTAMLLCLLCVCTCVLSSCEGPQGIQGEQGIQGVPGEKGDKGDKGDQGEQGIQGEKGMGIAHIRKTNTNGLMDTYTITYEDGSKTTFTVVNGEQGPQGIQGEVGKTGKNAYELYCEEYGFDGTLTEWLEVINSEIFNNYSVIFNLNGGTAPADFVRIATVRSGHSVALTTPTREGYVFLGWYIGEGVNEAKFDADDRICYDTVLNAKWAVQMLEVTFLSNEGRTLKVESVEYGQAATAPVATDVVDHEFVRWDTAFDRVTENLTVRPIYAPLTYTVAYRTSDGESLGSARVYMSKTPGRPADPERAGYYFIGWYTDEACTIPYHFDYSFGADTTVYAWLNESKPIYNADDLTAIADDPNGHYYLAADIDLNGASWTAIPEFGGELDGQGHTVSNFTLGTTEGGNYGFFGVNRGTVRNLVLSDIMANYNFSNANHSLGILVGSNEATGVIEGCRVEYSNMSVKIYCSSSNYDQNYSGGLVGRNSGIISDCYVDVSCSAFYELYAPSYSKRQCYMYLGGAVGYADMESSLIGITAKNDVYLSSSVSAYSSHDAYLYVCAGGMIGCATDNAETMRCVAKTNVSYNATVEEYEELSYRIGGFVGYADKNASIMESFAEGCITEGAISAKRASFSDSIGGFVGTNQISIRDCYANVDIIKTIASSANNIGGFVGYNAGSVLTSYSAGAVNAPKGPIGGFVGLEAEGGLVNKCFTTSNVTATDTANVNRFTGQTSGGSVLGSYYATDASFTVNGEAQTAPDATATGAATGQLCSSALLTDALRWNTNVWNVTGTGLPTLLWK